jgi:probable rRNA maturation factor
LLIHGILHLLGYDHERSELEARRMRRKERALLQAVLPIPTLVKPCAETASRQRAAIMKR